MRCFARFGTKNRVKHELIATKLKHFFVGISLFQHDNCYFGENNYILGSDIRVLGSDIWVVASNPVAVTYGNILFLRSTYFTYCILIFKTKHQLKVSWSKSKQTKNRLIVEESFEINIFIFIRPVIFFSFAIHVSLVQLKI